MLRIFHEVAFIVPREVPCQTRAFPTFERCLRILQRTPGILRNLLSVRDGTITVAQLLDELAFYDLGHIRRVLELYRSRVFCPEMGVCQSYYKINP
jgi:hypothetical protein